MFGKKPARYPVLIGTDFRVIEESSRQSAADGTFSLGFPQFEKELGMMLKQMPRSFPDCLFNQRESMIGRKQGGSGSNGSNRLP